MKWVYEANGRRVRGRVERVAGTAPVVGGPFFVTIWMADKTVVSYSGTVTRIDRGTVYFA